MSPLSCTLLFPTTLRKLTCPKPTKSSFIILLLRPMDFTRNSLFLPPSTQLKGMTNQPFVKANYPHHEGKDNNSSFISCYFEHYFSLMMIVANQQYPNFAYITFSTYEQEFGAGKRMQIRFVKDMMIIILLWLQSYPDSPPHILISSPSLFPIHNKQTYIHIYIHTFIRAYIGCYGGS